MNAVSKKIKLIYWLAVPVRPCMFPTSIILICDFINIKITSPGLTTLSSMTLDNTVL